MKFLNLLTTLLVLALMTLAAAAPATALVPFSESNFYNAKCDTIANVNGDCTVQSMHPGNSSNHSCPQGEKSIPDGVRSSKCVPV